MMMSFLLKGRLALIQKEGKREEGMSSAKSTFPFVQWNGTAHACLLACLLISGDTGDADRFVSNSIKARGGDMFLCSTPPIYNFRPKMYSVF